MSDTGMRVVVYWGRIARMAALTTALIGPIWWLSLKASREAAPSDFRTVTGRFDGAELQWYDTTTVSGKGADRAVKDGYLIRTFEDRRGYWLPQAFCVSMTADLERFLAEPRGTPLTLLIEPVGRRGIPEVYGLSTPSRTYLDPGQAVARLSEKHEVNAWLPVFIGALMLLIFSSVCWDVRYGSAPEPPRFPLGVAVEALFWAGLFALVLGFLPDGPLEGLHAKKLGLALWAAAALRHWLGRMPA